MSVSIFDSGEIFHRFSLPLTEISLPVSFNFPFNYDPHPLCRMAALELQQHLKSQNEWHHDFGIDHHVDGTNIGKMFGVLIVKNAQNELGYLAAFSGKLAGTNHLPGFVPPVVDLLDENGFYRIGENEISSINHRISQLEQSVEFLRNKEMLAQLKKQSEVELLQFRSAMKEAKKSRDLLRDAASHTMEAFEFELLKEKLKDESLKLQFDYKQLVKHWDQRIHQCQHQVDHFQNEIDALKEERKNRSASLQKRMFTCYSFLNANGQHRDLLDIFGSTETGIPPSGAGDCAGPKLLQYAYLNGLQPLVMAEFWWGQSPASEVRRHAHFYPSCNSKCKPILGHMLQGLVVDPNPVTISQIGKVEPEIIYDDEVIVVINKPVEYLSVPGNTDAESVYSFVKQKYPNADGPMMVHRLDMSTSGVMVIAKTMEAYLHLQNQFAERTVKKRYVALLDGVVDDDRGMIDLPLRVDLDDRPRQLVCYQYGKSAITHWRVIQRYDQQTLVHFFPLTGRTHQLRVHAAHQKGLNCPIVGDDLYGERSNRLHLHAELLEFDHPMSLDRMKFLVKAEF